MLPVPLRFCGPCGLARLGAAPHQSGRRGARRRGGRVPARRNARTAPGGGQFPGSCSWAWRTRRPCGLSY